MKKILIGAAIGVAATYVVYMLQKKGVFDGVCDNMHLYASKAKKNLKNAVDVTKNQAEYVKDRVEYEFQNGKEKLANLTTPEDKA